MTQIITSLDIETMKSDFLTPNRTRRTVTLPRSESELGNRGSAKVAHPKTGRELK
jgi:hypothetical protein